jgi:hypothetical protein
MAAGGLSFFLSCARARMRSRPSSMGWSSASGCRLRCAPLRWWSVCLPFMRVCACVSLQRRLIIGIGLSAALGAFALVPTEALRPRPSKPLFLYLVPLLRIQVARPWGLISR